MGIRTRSYFLEIGFCFLENKKCKKYTIITFYFYYSFQNVFKSSKYGNIIQNEAIQAYINRCTELCWLMSVQDPPMALYWDVAPDNKFDKAKYREYMKSGDYVDYIVWPCVLIQDDGNLMSKGVAQGRDHSKTQTLVTID